MESKEDFKEDSKDCKEDFKESKQVQVAKSPTSGRPVLDQGYTQIYAVEKQHFLPGEEQNPLFNCLLRVGEFVYAGGVDFTGIKMTLEDIPLIAPCIQQQQGGLSYMCVSSAIPRSSSFHDPVQLLYEATDFFVKVNMCSCSTMDGVFTVPPTTAYQVLPPP
jgi:hypothetical protein